MSQIVACSCKPLISAGHSQHIAELSILPYCYELRIFFLAYGHNVKYIGRRTELSAPRDSVHRLIELVALI